MTRSLAALQAAARFGWLFAGIEILRLIRQQMENSK